MPKRRRAAATSEPDQGHEEDDWKVVVTKKRKSNTNSKNELTEFLGLGENLSHNVYLYGKKGAWEEMSTYKRWNLDETNLEYEVGDYIAVLYEEETAQAPPKKRGRPTKDSAIEFASEDTEEISLDGNGIAKVLECRAVNEMHVYLRIVWLYRPEDTSEGRQPWHAENEVFPSNHMQLIDATACNGKVNLRQWGLREAVTTPGPREFVWRQTLDTTSKKQVFSPLERYCICDEPADLSSRRARMVQCTKRDCGKWMHSSCVEAAALKRAQVEKDSIFEKKIDLPDPFEKVANGLQPPISKFTAGLRSMFAASARGTPSPEEEKGGSAVKSASGSTTQKEMFEAKVVEDEENGGIGKEALGGGLMVEVRDVKKDQKVRLPMHCLFCEQEVDKREQKKDGEQKKKDGLEAKKNVNDNKDKDENKNEDEDEDEEEDLDYEVAEVEEEEDEGEEED